MKMNWLKFVLVSQSSCEHVAITVSKISSVSSRHIFGVLWKRRMEEYSTHPFRFCRSRNVFYFSERCVDFASNALVLSLGRCRRAWYSTFRSPTREIINSQTQSLCTAAPSWAMLCKSEQKILSASWVTSGCLLGASWASWVLLGVFWVLPGCSWVLLVLWVLLGCLLGVPGCSLVSPLCLLGVSWEHPG